MGDDLENEDMHAESHAQELKFSGEILSRNSCWRVFIQRNFYLLIESEFLTYSHLHSMGG